MINFIKTTLASSQLMQTVTLTHLDIFGQALLYFFPCGFLCLALGLGKCPQNNSPSNSSLCCYDVYWKRNEENTLEDLSLLLCGSHNCSCCLLSFHISLNFVSAFICCLQFYTWLFYFWGTNTSPLYCTASHYNGSILRIYMCHNNTGKTALFLVSSSTILTSFLYIQTNSLTLPFFVFFLICGFVSLPFVCYISPHL